MSPTRTLAVLAAAAALALSGASPARDLAKLVTKADVEKAAGARFADGTRPMPTQMSFAQQGGDLQVSIDVDPRDAGTTVRSWEATMKRMQPNARVETVPGIGKDAIFYSTRSDNGAVSADFDAPRVQLRVAVGGAKSPEQAKRIAVELARAVGPRVGK